MQTQRQRILHQQLNDIIFEGTFPTKTVVVARVLFEFTLTDLTLPRRGIDFQIELFSNIISCKGVSGKEFIKNLPSVLFYLIASAYAKYQADAIPALIKELYDFTLTQGSRDNWLLYKNSKDQYNLPTVDNKLNIFQKYWIIFNKSLDKKENMDLIVNVFEALQPWLDRELYTKIQEEKDARQNVFFNDKEVDRQLQEKAKKMIEDKNNPIKDDLDIVTLDE